MVNMPPSLVISKFFADLGNGAKRPQASVVGTIASGGVRPEAIDLRRKSKLEQTKKILFGMTNQKTCRVRS